MFKIALGVEYDGTNYIGWQKQQKGNSIQECIETALSHVANGPVITVCAGRTDKGVHALNQVIHCEVNVKRTEYNWLSGCNSHLDSSIRVLWVKNVPNYFDARKSAISRHYTYVIYNNPINSAILKNFTCWHYKQLDLNLMQEATQYWLGEHDFSSFRGAGCQSISPFRNVQSIKITNKLNNLIVIDIVANGFLYHMVRNMIGVLLVIGERIKEPLWALEVLKARDRRKAAMTAEASGLFLNKVHYPQEFAIPYDNTIRFIEDSNT